MNSLTDQIKISQEVTSTNWINPKTILGLSALTLVFQYQLNPEVIHLQSNSNIYYSHNQKSSAGSLQDNQYAELVRVIEELKSFYNKIAENQVELDTEIASVIYQNLWDLYE